MPSDLAPDDDRFTGFILGATMGDALGLPRERLSARRALRLFGSPPLHHRMCLGRGLCSDDTEHLVMTARSLLVESASADRFASELAKKMRWWSLSVPAGGGRATMLSCLKLLIGFGPERSGVFSAGNGPAMRSGILGLCLHRQNDPLAEFVRVSTRMTHTDPLAEQGALAVAIAVRHASRSEEGAIDFAAVLGELRSAIGDRKWTEIFDQIEDALRRGLSATEFGLQMGWRVRKRASDHESLLGVSGFICDTVAAALFCWLRWPNEVRRPVEEIIMMGGDTDSTAAIVGGLAGATLGARAIPDEWINSVIDWPTSISWLRRLSDQLESRFGNNQSVRDLPTLRLPWCLLFTRNIVFTAIVLIHVLRRMLPPY